MNKLLETKLRKKIRTLVEGVLREEYSDRIDLEIMSKQPDSYKELDELLKKFNVEYEIVPIKYLGYPQGVRVKIKHNGSTKTIPANGLVYAVHNKE